MDLVWFGIRAFNSFDSLLEAKVSLVREVLDNRNAVKGALWMCAASIMIAISASCIRELSQTYNTFQLVFFRSAIGLLLLSPWMLKTAKRGKLSTTRFPLYVLRTALSYTGMVCVFFALARMPIGEVYALLFLVPIITIVMAVFLLNEKAGIEAWVACGIAFIGALVILRPGVIAISIAAIAVLVTAVTYAGTNICIKALSKTDSPAQITFYGQLLALPLSLGPALYFWKMPLFSDLPMILALGTLQLLAGLFHAYSVRAADARIVQPFNFVRLPASVLFAFIFFSELPSPWTWLGAGMIFASSYYVLHKEAESRKKI
ncbi:MAG: hypothetical protein CMM37_13245 [Rhodospirillaceae bacterium]|nr:hypothetical protein [Rhodospirillaceae bacterium]